MSHPCRERMSCLSLSRVVARAHRALSRALALRLDAVVWRCRRSYTDVPERMDERLVRPA
jgi:hypothetical protein